MGLIYTDKFHADWSNRVFAIDGRFFTKDTYSFRAQVGFSQTTNENEMGAIVPMWDMAANAIGRKWSGSFSTKAYHSEFNPAVGFCYCFNRDYPAFLWKERRHDGTAQPVLTGDG